MEHDLERIDAFSRRIEDATSTRTDPWRFGTVCRNDGFPDRWDSNFLRVERPLGDATAFDLAAEADIALGDLRHREIVVEDENEGSRVAAGFGELGWEVDHLMYMVLRRPPDPEPDAVAEEISLEDARPLLLEVHRRGDGGMSEADAAMLADFRRLLVRTPGPGSSPPAWTGSSPAAASCTDWTTWPRSRTFTPSRSIAGAASRARSSRSPRGRRSLQVPIWCS